MICPPIKFKVFLNNISNVYIPRLFHGSKAKKKHKLNSCKGRKGRKEGERAVGKEGRNEE